MTSAAESSSIDESHLISETTNDVRSLLKTLIRYAMRTFYSHSPSSVVEYIYHYQCINLEDLIRLLHMTKSQIQSQIESLKREGIIIAETRKSTDSNSTFDPSTLFYKIDIIALINMVKYRLIKMQFAVADFERTESDSSMPYHCQKCLQKYSEFDIASLMKSSSDKDNLKCPKCQNIISEYEPTQDESVQCSLRLFHEQMTPLFEILKRIDEIVANEPSSIMTTADCPTNISTEKNDIQTNTDEQQKSLPEWFARSIDVTRD